MQHCISNVPSVRCNSDSSRQRPLRTQLHRYRVPRGMMVERLEDRVLLSTLDITATITADNHYALYVGKADGSQLTLVGWNEPGLAGDPGSFNWSLPETWTFTVGKGDYLYVLAWDDGGPQMWSGQFMVSDGSAVYSDTTSWVYTVSSGANPTTTGSLPSLDAVMSDIASAAWAAPYASAPQGSSPWYWIPGLSADAQLVWHDTLGDTSSSDGHYVIFRTVNPFVPPNSPPDGLQLNLSAAAIDENGTVTLEGAFTDTDGDDTHTVVIDWGFGEESSTLTLAEGVSSFQISHQYRDDNASGEPGTPSDAYSIGVTVADPEGASTTGVISVTVNNVVPVITSLSNSSPGCGDTAAGASVAVSGTFTDVGTLDTHTAVIDWGDGSTTTVTELDSASVTGEHTYSAGGIYTITLTVFDDDGGVSDSSITTAMVTGVGVNHGVLYVVGTDDADLVTINRQGNGWFKVHADFLSEGNFVSVSSDGVGRIVVSLCGGGWADHLNVAGNIRVAKKSFEDADYTVLDLVLEEHQARRKDADAADALMGKVAKRKSGKRRHL